MVMARAIADALVEFLLAREEAMAERRRSEPKEEIKVQIEPPVPAPVQSSSRMEPVPPQRPDTLLVDVREAARLLAISDRTLWRLTAPVGPIPATRFGRSVRYSMASLEEFVRKSERKRR
jgi:excisionase family DNA binding protein